MFFDKALMMWIAMNHQGDFLNDKMGGGVDLALNQIKAVFFMNPKRFLNPRLSHLHFLALCLIAHL